MLFTSLLAPEKDMLLGTVISQMQDETVALDTLLALDDLVLLARVRRRPTRTRWPRRVRL